MTDTGRIPGEGQPENAGAQPGGEPVDPDTSGTYTFADPGDSVSGASTEDEELLMPSPQGAWGDAPATTVPAGAQPRQQPAASQSSENGSAAHVPLPNSTPPHGTGVNGDTTSPPRRPLHLGPPVPEQSGAVRPLSDRGQTSSAAGPATGQVPVPAQATAAPAEPVAAPEGPAPDGPDGQDGPDGPDGQTVQGDRTGQQPVEEAADVPVQQAMPQQSVGIPQYTPPTDTPEYLDADEQSPDSLPGPQLGELPPENGDRAQQNGQPEAAAAEETVAPDGQQPVEDAPDEPGSEASVAEVPDDTTTAHDTAADAGLPAPGEPEAEQPGITSPVDPQSAGPQSAGPQSAGPETVTEAAAADGDEAVAGTPADQPEPEPAPAMVAESGSGGTAEQESAPEDGAAAGPREAPDGVAEVPAELPPETADEPAASTELDETEGESVALISEDGSAADAAPSTAGEPADGAPVQEQPHAEDAEPDAEQDREPVAAPDVREAEEAAELREAPFSEKPGSAESAALGAEPDLEAGVAQEPQETPEAPVPETSDAPEAEGVPAPESGPTQESAQDTAQESAQKEGADTTATQEPAAAQDELQAQDPEEPQDRTEVDAADGAAAPEEKPEAEQAEQAESEVQAPAADQAAGESTDASQDEGRAQDPSEDRAQDSDHDRAQDPSEDPAPGRDPAEGLVPVPDPEAIPEAAEPADADGADDRDDHAGGHADGAGQDGSDSGSDAAGEPGSENRSAPARSVGEPAPGFPEADREAVHRLMRERRDIRNGFRNDPIPDDVLLRVLEAAHTAPSVGHSQPWDFVVIRSEETRQTMHELAQRQREAYARSLPKARAKQFKELKVEAILDAPVNIVVTADPTRGGRHTLGRHTQPQMAPYSSALAVENLWLAARAEGLGVGWVSFFDEREMVRTLELPEHMEVVAYLCVGYVDEFPAEPELAQAGWSKRRPLSWVVHEESYGRRVLPGAAPHDLLSETVDAIRPLDAKALGDAWERQKRMTKPSGALGMLEIISAQLCGLSRKCPPPLPEPAAVAVFAGDHGVHAQGVTPWPQEVTGQMVANFLNGGAVCNSFANQVGAEVCIIDVGVKEELPAGPGLLPRKVRAGTADMTTGPALTREEAQRAVEVGIETARDLVTAGNKALLTGEMGIANTTASAALISACTGSDPAEITGRGTGINDETHARKVEVVRRALELHQPDPADPIGLLAAVGGLEHAALVGLILGGASLRTPVILDGVSAGAAALVARALAPEALAACIAGHRSAEPGHVAALNKLGLRPLVDLDLRLGEGTGALLALPMVQSAARAMHEVATFDAAGVTEKN